MTPLHLEVLCGKCGKWFPDLARALTHWLNALLPEEVQKFLACSGAMTVPGSLPSAVEVIFLSAGDLRVLARHYLGPAHDSWTDILTFPETHQILIAGEVLLQQAHEHNWDPENEWLFLVAHGVLHLIGFSDHHPSLRDTMHRIQYLWVNSFPPTLRSCLQVVRRHLPCPERSCRNEAICENFWLLS